MVQAVMFLGPGIRMNPVTPVEKTPPATGESLAGIAGRYARYPVITTVGDRMGNQCPACKNSLADQQG